MFGSNYAITHTNPPSSKMAQTQIGLQLDPELNFAYLNVNGIRPVPGDRVQTWEFLSGVGCEPLLENSRQPTNADG